MNRALEAFLSESACELAKAPSIRRFMALRYDIMSKSFPHKSFSVATSDPGFFGRAYWHLHGRPFAEEGQSELPDREVSEYEVNYRAWIRANRA